MKVESKKITEPYWSNCFVEAMKAKIKNPSKVKITIVPPWLNEIFCPHFLWSDGEHDYDFGTPGYLKGCEILYFEGCIRQYKLGFNQRWLDSRKKLKKANKNKKD